MTQIFMLRIRLRTCQGGVPGGETAPAFEVLTNSSVKTKHTGGLSVEKRDYWDPTGIPGRLLT